VPRNACRFDSVSCGCDRSGYGRFFNQRFARRLAKRYRKRGLDGASQLIADFVASRGVEGATVLEIGGGVGEIQLELLKAGAARTTNLELSPGYESEGRRLAEEAGVADRAERQLRDIAADPEAVEPADVVILNRVVCCYPDYERLLGAAADHARRLLVFSYPPRNVFSRTFLTLANAMQALLRNDFRSFTHPPEAMLAVLDRRGLTRTYEHHGFVWQIAGLERV
jgi:2-polyprenyl-3-methyl-5-hydroxy-6-metoxy-1,4-benzoquinol methylase